MPSNFLGYVAGLLFRSLPLLRFFRTLGNGIFEYRRKSLTNHETVDAVDSEVQNAYESTAVYTEL